MFRLVTILISLFFASSMLSAQSTALLSGEIRYTVLADMEARKAKITDMKTAMPDIYAMMGEDMLAALELLPELPIYLYFNQEAGICFVEKDAVLEAEDPLVYSMAVGFIENGHDRCYLSATEKKRLRENLRDGGVSYQHILEDWNPFNWQLGTETKEIGQYLCRKASGLHTFETYQGDTVTREITAWFAPELPFPYGPMGFDALPGIVLEVTISSEGESSTTYRAEEIRIEPNSKKKIPQLNKPSRITTEEELDREAEELMKTIMQGRG